MLHRHRLCFGIAIVWAALLAQPASCQHSAGGVGGGLGAGPASRTNPNANLTTGTSGPTDLGIRGVYLSGKVQMQDGMAPPQPVTIERICGTGYRKAEAYTDSKGHFSFQIGQEQSVNQDASSDGGPSTPNPTGSSVGNPPNRLNTAAGASQTGSSTGVPRNLMGCELTASLPGFRSDSLNLDQHRRLDNPDVGTLILHRIANVEGSTISVTTLQAPKDARKAFDKGREALRKEKLDEAQQQFAKAVEIFPKFAEAWYQLALLQEKKENVAEARKSYSQAITADPKLVSPYLPLARLALHEKNWDDLADTTARLLKLDAVDFPEAYYDNAIGNLRLKKLADAEASAREALKLDVDHHFPQTAHILGVVLLQKGDYAGAADQFRNYLQIAPNASDAAQVKQQLAEIDRRASATKKISGDSEH